MPGPACQPIPFLFLIIEQSKRDAKDEVPDDILQKRCPVRQFWQFTAFNKRMVLIGQGSQSPGSNNKTLAENSPFHPFRPRQETFKEGRVDLSQCHAIQQVQYPGEYRYPFANRLLTRQHTLDKPHITEAIARQRHIAFHCYAIGNCCQQPGKRGAYWIPGGGNKLCHLFEHPYVSFSIAYYRRGVGLPRPLLSRILGKRKQRAGQAHAPTIPVRLPQAVARKLTVSLFIQGRPRRNWVGVPQLCRRFSVSFWQAGQKYIACTVAPSRLSNRLPTMPLSRATRGSERSERRKP